MTQPFPITDGFLYNTLLRPNMTFLASALHEYELLRRSGAYRTRWLTVPEGSGISIPADDAYEYQADVTPGSVYWAWIFTTPDLYTDFSIQIWDGCSDVPLFSEVVNMGKHIGTIAPGQGKQIVLPRLLVVGQPGILNVEICSMFGTAATNTQLILCGAEPVPESECGK